MTPSLEVLLSGNTPHNNLIPSFPDSPLVTPTLHGIAREDFHSTARNTRMAPAGELPSLPLRPSNPPLLTTKVGTLDRLVRQIAVPPLHRLLISLSVPCASLAPTSLLADQHCCRRLRPVPLLLFPIRGKQHTLRSVRVSRERQAS